MTGRSKRMFALQASVLGRTQDRRETLSPAQQAKAKCLTQDPARLRLPEVSQHGYHVSLTRASHLRIQGNQSTEAARSLLRGDVARCICICVEFGTVLGFQFGVALISTWREQGGLLSADFKASYYGTGRQSEPIGDFIVFNPL